MLVRAALRLAADVPTKTTTHDLPQLARFLRRTLLSRNASDTPAVRALSCAYTTALSNYRRTYATTTRATKPTATVKKAVKAQAKKPAAKKAVAKKPAATPKKKPVAKKKRAAKKPAPKKRVKKVVSPEAKAKAEITALKKRALKEPVTYGVITAWAAFVKDKGQGSSGVQMTNKIVDMAAQFKALTPAELEHYNHLANEQTAAKRKVYLDWVHSYTAAEIRDANRARLQLRKGSKTRSPKRGAKYTAKITDDRAVKKLRTSYNSFLVERHATGDFKSIKASDAAKLIGAEWKALSASEKKKYEDIAAADKARYEREIAA